MKSLVLFGFMIFASPQDYMTRFYNVQCKDQVHIYYDSVNFYTFDVKTKKFLRVKSYDISHDLRNASLQEILKIQQHGVLYAKRFKNGEYLLDYIGDAQKAA